MKGRVLLVLMASLVGFSAWPAAAASEDVSIRTGQPEYTPQSLHIYVGDSVTWTNNDSGLALFYRGHTVTADDGSFDSGTVNEQQSFTFRFRAPGVFPYHCSIHAGMTGSVVVGRRVSHSPTPTPTPTPTRTPKTSVPSKSPRVSPGASSPSPSPTTSIDASSVGSNASSAGTIISIAIVSIAVLVGLGYFVYLRFVRER